MYTCDVEHINEEINILKSLVPDFNSKDITTAKVEDNDDNRFSILDFPEDNNETI